MAGPASFNLFSQRSRPVIIALILLAITLAGIVSFRAPQRAIDSDLRAGLLNQAVALSHTIHPDQIEALSFTGADKELPEFQRLRQQMIAYQTVTNYRGIYSLARRNGQLIFGPESYAEEDPQASPPGTVYEQPTEQDLAIFETGLAIVEGPSTDEYGTFISALAPVLDPHTGEVLMVVGIDVEAADYQAALVREQLIGLLPVLVLGAIMVGGLSITWWREGLPATQQARLRYAEVYAIALFGLAATLFVTLAFSAAEARSHAESFYQLAATKAQLVIKAFDNLQDNSLSSLVQFFSGSQLFVGRGEFRVFVAPLAQGTAIQALGWVPYVPASQKAEVETQAQADGLDDFYAWQMGSSGQRQPVSARSVYYPILYAEPQQGNQTILGYDLGSEPIYRAALESARATGLPTATDPILMVQEPEGEPSLLAIAPIFSANLIEQLQSGFVVALVQVQPFLQAALFIEPGGDESTVVDLYKLEGRQPPRLISSSSSTKTEFDNEKNNIANEFQSTDRDVFPVFPLFIFDKSYALVVRERNVLPAAILFQASGAAALGGLLVTVLVTAFATYILGRRDDLATQVQARTAELRESKEYLSTLLDTLGDVVFITRLPDHNVEYVNRAVTENFGYPTEEVIGRTTKRFYAGSGYEEYGARVRAAMAKGQNRVQAEVELIHKDGHTIWVEMHATVRSHDAQPPSLITVVRDITERSRSRERIETQLKRLASLHSIDVAITSSLDLQTVLGVVLEQTIAHLGVGAACILLLDPVTQKLTYGTGRGFRSTTMEKVELRLGESVAGRVALTREMVHIPNPANDPRFTDNMWLKSEGIIEYYAAPLIAKGNVSGVLEICNRSPFEANEEWWDFLKTLADQAAIAVDSARLLQDLKLANVNIVDAYDATIAGWSQALDLRDHETEGHTQRVTEMTLKLALATGIGEAELVNIWRGGLLHDIGKIGVPDSILLKPGELTEAEWQLIHKHPRFAFDMLSPITYLAPALDIPYCHHEKWDGTGYPRGLKGEQIPLGARIFAAADVYDALTSDRPYRKALFKTDALAYIRAQSGKHFDPNIVELFLKLIVQE